MGTTTADYDNRGLLATWRAGRSDWRLHALSVFALSVAFVCLAATLLIVTNLAAMRDRWSHAGRATVYLRDGVSDSDVAELSRALDATPGVRGVRFVSSVEARREVVVDERDATLASLPPNAFPASLEVAFEDDLADADLTGLVMKVKSVPAVETVETYQRWTERLSTLLGGGVAASIALAGIVLCAVASVIGSTMRLLLHRRRIEVEVLKLVGATDAFVRRPFVLEGAAQGGLGALASLVLLGILFLIVRGRFDSELANLLGIAPSFLPLHYSAGLVALGGALGAATAIVTLRRMVVV